MFNNMEGGHIFLILLVILIFSLIVAFKYPKARRDESVIDNYFGTNVIFINMMVIFFIP